MHSAYPILEEPENDVYASLLDHSLLWCDSCLLVTRSANLATSQRRFESVMEPYLIEERESSSWPGTMLLDGTAKVQRYRLVLPTVTALRRATSRLYAWVGPDLPEDLCLLRPDKSPWLVTISHEAEAFLVVDSEERRTVIGAVPGLKLGDTPFDSGRWERTH